MADDAHGVGSSSDESTPGQRAPTDSTEGRPTCETDQIRDNLTTNIQNFLDAKFERVRSGVLRRITQELEYSMNTGSRQSARTNGSTRTPRSGCQRAKKRYGGKVRSREAGGTENTFTSSNVESFARASSQPRIVRTGW